MTIQDDPVVEQVTIGMQLEQFYLARHDAETKRVPPLLRYQAKTFSHANTWERLSMIRQPQVVR
jgi:hypothetical protein